VGEETVGAGDLLRKAKRFVVKSINYNKTIDGMSPEFRVPNIYGISVPPSEGWMTGLLSDLMQQEKRAFLDVGANLGQTLLKVKSVDAARKYVGFEPNPNCVFYLKQLVYLNNFPDCTIIPAGLFTSDCFLELSISTDDIVNAGASVIKDFRPGKIASAGEYVALVRWETLPAEIRDVAYGIVKVDVEGAELDAVKSLTALLDRDSPILIIEILPVHRADNKDRIDRQNKLLALLMSRRYEMFRVRKSADDLYLGMDRINSIEVHSDLSLCDYVFRPADG
jgi:FkbM family methyltransferase